jgi:hypothetical protein
MTKPDKISVELLGGPVDGQTTEILPGVRWIEIPSLRLWYVYELDLHRSTPERVVANFTECKRPPEPDFEYLEAMYGGLSDD